MQSPLKAYEQMTPTGKVARAENYFHQCVKDWNVADRECTRAYAVWQDAKQRRERLVFAKNNAWGDLEMVREGDG